MYWPGLVHFKHAIDSWKVHDRGSQQCNFMGICLMFTCQDWWNQRQKTKCSNSTITQQNARTLLFYIQISINYVPTIYLIDINMWITLQRLDTMWFITCISVVINITLLSDRFYIVEWNSWKFITYYNDKYDIWPVSSCRMHLLQLKISVVWQKHYVFSMLW